MYSEDEYLLISGLQHFSFCRRQWALIHVENVWADNLLTTEGNILHERAHDSNIKERRGDVITVRGVRVNSSTLGITGQCDVLEYHADPHGIPITGEEGKWIPYPVEYKRGHSKAIEADRLQLCAQAMCLEEMLCCDVLQGALFYGETRRREVVIFSEELRKMVKDYLIEMHSLFSRGYTPKVKPGNGCRSCSLKEQCLPKLMRNRKVKDYILRALEDPE
ncbi:MAG: CRISPR-associated protein Cas4 [Firmicutes bacterium]|nr:CRISPR-associated protein Cas4 [Bacillota bacterium]